MVAMDSHHSNRRPTLEDIATADFPTLQLWYELLEGAPSPPSLKRDILRLHLAWTLQSLQQKNTPRSQRQRLLKKALQSEQSPTLTYSPGTRLIREWQGKTHEVTILESGYLYAGREYQSLSKIANEITGAHWSGPKFFRMKKTLK